MKNFNNLLTGDDLRSLGNSSEIISKITDQKTFDKLFKYLFNNNRATVMKTIDVIEKVTLENSKYLQKHKVEIINLSNDTENIELKWHLAQLLGRLEYTNIEIKNVWGILKKWTLDKTEGKIVRVNSLETLYGITKLERIYSNEFDEIIKSIKKENIPSINARIKKLK